MAQLSTKLPWDLASPRWASELNPILALPILQGIQIDNVVLTMSTPRVINHLLQRKPQGWFLVDNDSDSTVWRTEPFNNLTLTLESSADTTVSIWVY